MRRAQAGVLVVCLVLLATCDQAPSPFQPRPSLVPAPLASVSPDPTSETISLTVTDTAYGSMSGNSNQATSPYIRKFRVEGTASIAITKRVAEASNPTPNPIEARHTLGIRVAGNSIRFPDQANPAKMYVTVSGNQTIWQAYAGGGTQPNQSGTRADGTPWWCGPSVGSYCYSYSGSGSVSITPLQGDIHLSVDSSTVSIGSSVRFTLTADSAEGQSLPIQVETAEWIPAATDSGGEPSEATGAACTFSGATLQCTRMVLGSGSLHVVARVSGFRREATQSVRVREGSLTLTASKSTVAQGETVTFTASWSDGAPLQIDRWTFFPTGGAAQYFVCPAYNPCSRAIQQTGEMVVQVVRNGKYRTARAQVTVIPCPNPNGDSFLDNMQVRHRLAELMQQSNPQQSEGALVSEANWDHVTDGRHETGTYFIRHPDGSVTEVAPIVVRQNACSFFVDRRQRDSLLISLPIGDVLVQVHTHVNEAGDLAFGGCPFKDASGEHISLRYPGDVDPGSRIAYQGSAGPSPGDWLDTSVEQYVIDHEPGDTSRGIVYKIPKGAVSSGDPIMDGIGRSASWSAACGWQ